MHKFQTCMCCIFNHNNRTCEILYKTKVDLYMYNQYEIWIYVRLLCLFHICILKVIKIQYLPAFLVGKW